LPSPIITGATLTLTKKSGKRANSGCASRWIALSNRHISGSRWTGSLSIASISGPIDRAGAASSGILPSISNPAPLPVPISTIGW